MSLKLGNIRHEVSAPSIISLKKYQRNFSKLDHDRLLNAEVKNSQKSFIILCHLLIFLPWKVKTNKQILFVKGHNG